MEVTKMYQDREREPFNILPLRSNSDDAPRQVFNVIPPSFNLEEKNAINLPVGCRPQDVHSSGKYFRTRGGWWAPLL
jgi:hypothetical protein